MVLSFLFHARIDSVKCPIALSFLPFIIVTGALFVWHHQGGFVAIHEAEGIHISASLAKELTADGLTHFVLSLRWLNGVWVLAVENGEEPAAKCAFKWATFELPIDSVIGECEVMSVPIFEESPVARGPFALFSLPLELIEREAIVVGTLNRMVSLKLILSSNSPDLIIRHSLLKCRSTS
jgi:hypothetical protein